MTAMAAPDRVEASSAFSWVTAAGWALLAAVTYIWTRVTVGGLAIRSLIRDYEAAHGAIPIERGMVMENGRFVRSPALSELGQALVERADYFYPFGVGVLIALAAFWCAGSAMAVSARPRLRNILWGAAGLSLAAQLYVLAGPIYQMVIITE